MGSNDDSVESAEVDLSMFSALDIADTGVGDGNTIEAPETPSREATETFKDVPKTSVLLPSRPQMRRNQPQPPPPQQPPLPPPPSQDQQAANQNDSLSLAQLKRLITDMPKPEARAYDFTYDDAASFADELEEWFSYAEEQRRALVGQKATFDQRFQDFLKRKYPEQSPDGRWLHVHSRARKEFIAEELQGLKSSQVGDQRNCLESLVYIALGVWGETAAMTDEAPRSGSLAGPADDRGTIGSGEERASGFLDAIQDGVLMILECDGLQPVYDRLRDACLREPDDDLPERVQPHQPVPKWRLDEVLVLHDAMTLMYLIVEAGRRQIKLLRGLTIYDHLAALQPNLLNFLLKVFDRLRWDDSAALPMTKIVLLTWKSILLLFGGSEELHDVKRATLQETGRTVDDESKTLITASPLDYHLFRQEITSKYPAYNPRPPLIPLESDSSSILPPIQTYTGRNGNNRSRTGLGPANAQGSNSSILHQPVHIATPAPSPPPSPGGPGGKAGKKQNYQTNQNFPFLYPPLDLPQNGTDQIIEARPQYISVDSRWERSDVPASILEAGELFAGRMRMSRALRQLWEERERYMRFERGWTGAEEGPEDEDELLRDGRGESEALSPETRRRLHDVEEFYSLVIVLLKVVLAHVTALVTQSGQPEGQNGVAPTAPMHEAPNGDGQAQGPQREVDGRPGGASGDADESEEEKGTAMSLEELEAVRMREITSKGVSGILLLLLKWFKISHVLKFEFLAQLLLDSNYLPLILKLFAHQDLDKAVESNIDRDDLSVFALFKKLATQPSTAGDGGAKSADEDDACPPPVIRRHRARTNPAAAAAPAPAPTSDAGDAAPSKAKPTEVDELGCPIPSEPITVFSWRNFFSSINMLRVMQKICKRKAHRNLLLVQYKSSTILKKALKVPQRELRLYTLKLFKNQVPYCGRKWRQTNMRVITAVYLCCRPELRDDWLAGSDVDADVEEALPLEQALRALTHWHNLKRYPAQMGHKSHVLEEEQDFFARELERMDVADDGSAADDGQRDGLWDGPLPIDAW